MGVDLCVASGEYDLFRNVGDSARDLRRVEIKLIAMNVLRVMKVYTRSRNAPKALTVSAYTGFFGGVVWLSSRSC